MSDKELASTINQILTVLENNYRYNYGKKISYDEVFAMVKDLYVLCQKGTCLLFNVYNNVLTPEV